MNDADFLKVAYDAYTREAEHTVKFYPFLKEEVKVAKLFGLFCVVMPVFKPVEKEKREDSLDSIKEVLIKFKDGGKKYNEEDVRWRHVGMYKDKDGVAHCILYDLADMADLNDSEQGKRDFLEDHMDVYRIRITGKRLQT